MSASAVLRTTFAAILSLPGTASLAAINQTFSFDDVTAPQAISHQAMSGIASTCAVPGSAPAVVAGTAMYSYQTHTFYNSGPARCVTVTLNSPACVSTIAVNVYSPSVTAATRSQNWLGEDGTGANKTASVTFSFNAPANAPIVFWVNRTSAVGSGSFVACNYTFQSAQLTAAAVTLDIDGDGHADALTDGLLVLRYLLGFRGNSLITGAVATGATRTSANDIESRLESILP
jgi:hypothetical protein